MAEGWASQANLFTCSFGWLLGVRLVLRGSELSSKGCNHVGKEGIRCEGHSRATPLHTDTGSKPLRERLWLEKRSCALGHPSLCWVSSGHWPFANYRYYPVACGVRSSLAVSPGGCKGSLVS